MRGIVGGWKFGGLVSRDRMILGADGWMVATATFQPGSSVMDDGACAKRRDEIAALLATAPEILEFLHEIVDGVGGIPEIEHRAFTLLRSIDRKAEEAAEGHVPS